MLSNSITEKTENRLYKILLFITFAVGFALCCLITYSDGDDAFFLKTLENHGGIFDFVSFLTKTMNGRVSTTFTLWFVFSSPIWFWRFLNALAITEYVFMFTKISQIIRKENSKLLSSFFACCSFAVMGVGIFGYSCLWITGSVNYLWPCVTAMIALYPILKTSFNTKTVIRPSVWIAAIFAGIYTCLAQEQIAAITVVASLIMCVQIYLVNKKIHLQALISCLLFLFATVLLIAAPLTSNRTEREVLRWLPDYLILTAPQKLFITLQWIAHSVSHGLKWIFTAIWVYALTVFIKRKQVLHTIVTVILIIVSVCSSFFSVLSDVGLDKLDMTKKVEHAPLISDLGTVNIIALCFWLLVLVLSFAMILKILSTAKLKIATGLIYLAGIASLAVMFFSPTIYASGERSLYYASVCLLIIAVIIANETIEKNKINIFKFAVPCCMAALQLFDNLSYLLEMI